MPITSTTYPTIREIVTDPDAAIASARTNLDRMRMAARGQAQRWLDEWERLLDGSVEELLDNLTSRSPKGRELRQNSPFSGLLSSEERAAVLTAWRGHTPGGET